MIIQWLRQHGQEPNKVQLERDKYLRGLDARCGECLQQPGVMLCDGYRPYFDQEQSDFYNRPCEKMRYCVKAKEKYRIKQLEKRIQHSFLPSPDKIDFSGINIVREGTQFVINNIEIPLLVCEPATVAFMKQAMRFVLASVHAGYNGKYVYPYIMTKAYDKSWNDIPTELVNDCDWLFVERLDYTGSIDFKREAIFSAVMHRITNNLPTVITVGPDFQPKTDTEILVQEAMQTMPRFPKELL